MNTPSYANGRVSIPNTSTITLNIPLVTIYDEDYITISVPLITNDVELITPDISTNNYLLPNSGIFTALFNVPSIFFGNIISVTLSPSFSIEKGVPSLICNSLNLPNTSTFTTRLLENSLIADYFGEAIPYSNFLINSLIPDFSLGTIGQSNLIEGNCESPIPLLISDALIEISENNIDTGCLDPGFSSEEYVLISPTSMGSNFNTEFPEISNGQLIIDSPTSEITEIVAWNPGSSLNALVTSEIIEFLISERSPGYSISTPIPEGLLTFELLENIPSLNWDFRPLLDVFGLFNSNLESPDMISEATISVETSDCISDTLNPTVFAGTFVSPDVLDFAAESLIPDLIGDCIFPVESSDFNATMIEVEQLITTVKIRPKIMRSYLSKRSSIICADMEIGTPKTYFTNMGWPPYIFSRQSDLLLKYIKPQKVAKRKISYITFIIWNGEILHANSIKAKVNGKEVTSKILSNDLEKVKCSVKIDARKITTPKRLKIDVWVRTEREVGNFTRYLLVQ